MTGVYRRPYWKYGTKGTDDCAFWCLCCTFVRAGRRTAQDTYICDTCRDGTCQCTCSPQRHRDSESINPRNYFHRSGSRLIDAYSYALA